MNERSHFSLWFKLHNYILLEKKKNKKAFFDLTEIIFDFALLFRKRVY